MKPPLLHSRLLMNPLSQLKVKLFADGADLKSMLDLYTNPFIKGMTTNPTLMRKVGVTDYEAFAREVLQTVKDKPISFEVFSDDFPEMKRQALKIAAWQKNVYVKIPITNTRAESALPLINELGQSGVQLNITAILTLEQVRGVAEALNPAVASVVSVFAGRIADTGRDPVPIMMESLERMLPRPRTELIWASPRELLNVFQADAIGCHVITATPSILAKLDVVGKDLMEYSLDTVRMFHRDAAAAGYRIDVPSTKTSE